MQRIGDEYTITDPQGNAVEYATITVYLAGTTTLATVYPATGGPTPTTPSANPFTTDEYGRWRIALNDGRYDFVVSGITFASYTIPNVCVFDNTITFPSPMLGTVTSVALAVPTGLAVSGGPITGTGTFTISYTNWVKNRFLGGPASGADATPTIRALVMDDLPAFGPTASTVFGSATKASVVTTDSLGRVVTLSEITVTPAWASVTGTPTTLSGYGISNAVELKFTNIVTVSFTNTTAMTDLFGTGVGSKHIAANRLVAGTTIRIKLSGRISSLSSTAIEWTLNLGGSAILYVSTTMPATALSSNLFNMEVIVTVRTIGATGTCIGQAWLSSASGANSYTFGVPSTPVTAEGTIDTTTAGDLALYWKFAAASGSNSLDITNLQLFLEG